MAATTGTLPRKAQGLIARELGDEIVVIDSATDTAHTLSGLTADVWRALDAGRLPEAPQAELNASLDELSSAGLITYRGMDRRTLLRRAGTVAVVGGTMITINVPHAMAANSTDAATTTALTGSPLVAGSSTMTAAVTSGGNPVTVGTVAIYDVTGGAHTQVASGSAPSVQYTASNATGKTYRAEYSGGTGFASSNSANFTPQPVPTTTTLTGTPVTKKSSQGNPSTWTATVTVAATSGTTKPGGTVNITTVGATAPTSVTLNSAGTATFTVTNPTTAGIPVRVSATYPGNPSSFGTSTTSPSGDTQYTTT